MKGLLLLLSLMAVLLLIVRVYASPTTSVSYSQSDSKILSAKRSRDLPQYGEVALTVGGNSATLEPGNYSCHAESGFGVSDRTGGPVVSYCIENPTTGQCSHFGRTYDGEFRAYLYRIGGASVPILTSTYSDDEQVSAASTVTGYAEVSNSPPQATMARTAEVAGRLL